MAGNTVRPAQAAGNVSNDPMDKGRGFDPLRINKGMNKLEDILDKSYSIPAKVGAYFGRRILAIPSALFNGITALVMGIFSCCNETAARNFNENGKKALKALSDLPIVGEIKILGIKIYKAVKSPEPSTI